MVLRKRLGVLTAIALTLGGAPMVSTRRIRNRGFIDTFTADEDLEGNERATYSAREKSKGPMKIGEHYSIRISSDQQASEILPTVSDDGTRADYLLQHPGAPFLSVHFSLFDFAPGCSMRMEDALGEGTVMTDKGKLNLTTFWAHHVAGDEMKLSVQCSGGLEGAVFDIDDYVAGIPELFEDDLDEPDRLLVENSHIENPFEHRRDLSICAADDKLSAACFEDDYPLEYRSSMAVARLYINGGGACTGWMLSDDILITNHHCISSDTDVRNSDFEMMAEDSNCIRDGGRCWFCSRGKLYDGLRLLMANKELDFAVVQLAGRPGSTFGYLELEADRIPAVDEPIYIPQHPGARSKMVALLDSSEKSGECRVLNLDRGNCGSSSPYSDVRYSCDTEGGTSGSPVISRFTNKVIALHHCGGACSGNMGVPMFIIQDHIQQYLNPNGIQCEPGETKWAMSLVTNKNGKAFTYRIVNNASGEIVAFSTGFKSRAVYRIEKCLGPGDYSMNLQDSRARGVGSLQATLGNQESALVTSGRFGRSQTIRFIVESLNPTAEPTKRPTNRPTAAPSSQPSTEPSAGPTSGPTTSAQPSSSLAPSPAPSNSAQPSSEPSPSPTSSPTDRPAQNFALGQCFNNPSWDFDGSGKDCDWLAGQSPSICKKKGQGGRAHNNCQNVCRCHSDCEDDPFWVTKKGKGCNWVAELPKKRCGSKSKSYEFAFEACRESCGCTES